MSLSRRRTLPGALILGLTLLLGVFALPATPARADVDMEIVVESLTEQAYYVDPGARYMRNDAAIEALRSGVESNGPAFVVVVPSGSAATLIKQVSQRMGRKGTYIVLAGDQFRAASTKLPGAKVKQAYAKSTRANPGRPDKAVIDFLRLLPLEPGAKPAPRQRVNTGRSPSPKAKRTQSGEAPAADNATPKPAAAQDDSGGGTPIWLIAIIVLAVAGLGAGGVLFWRKRNGKPAAGQPGPLYQGDPQGQGQQGPQGPYGQPYEQQGPPPHQEAGAPYGPPGGGPEGPPRPPEGPQGP